MMRHLPLRLLLCLGLASSAAAGCASADPPLESTDPDQGPGMQDADDGSPKDMRTPAPEDMRTSTPDMRTPPPEEDMRAPMVCTPNQTRCQQADDGAGDMGAEAEPQATETCAPDGSGWMAPAACPPDQVCEAGACAAPRICEEGEATCLDETTRQICRPGGMAYRAEVCPQGQSCVTDECVSGAGTGTTCQAHDECAGGKCHCGEQTAEGCADTFAQPAYCTQTCQGPADCAQGERCLDSDTHLITSQVANYDHCLPGCQGACSFDGLECKWGPTRGTGDAIEWAQVCYFAGVKSIGEDCDNDAECIGGRCLRDYLGRGYCTRRCETGGCPPDTACVELRVGEFWCSATCGDGSIGSSEKCPLDLPDDRLDVTCALEQVHGGGAARVCVAAD